MMIRWQDAARSGQKTISDKEAATLPKQIEKTEERLKGAGISEK